MNRRRIDYRNGRIRFVGHLFDDGSGAGAPRPGVLVFPEAFGLNAHALERAERLAEMGYVALAVDPHGEGAVFGELQELRPAIHALHADRAEWRSRMLAAYETLLAQPQVDRKRIAAVGFCFGGACCFELARAGAPLAAIATFHAGLLPQLPTDTARIGARVLICHGAEDSLVARSTLDAVIEELKRDRVDWQLVIYGNAAHSFTDPDADRRQSPALRYHALAEARSWKAMRGLFDEVFT